MLVLRVLLIVAACDIRLQLSSSASCLEHAWLAACLFGSPAGGCSPPREPGYWEPACAAWLSATCL